MSTERDALDYLGAFLIKNNRDRALSTLEKTLNGSCKAKPLEDFQVVMQSLSKEQREELFDGIAHIISDALHDILFNLQEENHFNNRIKLLVDGYDVVKISDGLHGEQFGTGGWIERFSEYKETK